jgi:hypothetical protein
MDKKLLKLLKKTDRVRVTVVGTFLDGKERVFGHMNCCRYKIEVQKLLDIQNPKRHRKNEASPKETMWRVAHSKGLRKIGVAHPLRFCSLQRVAPSSSSSALSIPHHTFPSSSIASLRPRMPGRAAV